MRNFEVFPPKCEVLLLDTAQKEDVFKQFVESIEKTCAGLFFSEAG